MENSLDGASPSSAIGKVQDLEQAVDLRGALQTYSEPVHILFLAGCVLNVGSSL